MTLEVECFYASLKAILDDRKTFAGFLDVIFHFLYRYTDFYHEKKHEYGLPIGMKEKIVMRVLQRYDPKYQYVSDNSLVSKAIEEVGTEANNENEQLNEINNSKKQIENDLNFYMFKELQNGYGRKNFRWIQSASEIHLKILLRKPINSPKHIGIQIEGNHVKVISKLDPEGAPIFDEVLSAKCKLSATLLRITDGKLKIVLDKMKKVWWDHFLALELPKTDVPQQIINLPPDPHTMDVEKYLKRLNEDWGDYNI